ncbi:META domain-containing protein [Micromonospora fluostatini]|uniref:hypothetical protein n=1 Tax=Micromonospora sp. JCM 30529 TaxID=3421643 RepID=UPI003D163F33
MRPSARIVGVLAVLGLLLTGCLSTDGGEDTPGDAPPGGPVGWAVGEPTGLIGSWTVAGVEGAAGSVLRLAPDGLTLVADCVRRGQWRAHPDGLFVAYLSSLDGDRGCTGADPVTPGWLSRATGFRSDGDARVLVDEQEQVVARLQPGARPTAGPYLPPADTEPPVVTDEARRRLDPAARLPGTLVVPGRDGVLGRWVPASGALGGPRAAYVELRADGEWRGSDGCNGQAGRWVLGPAGAFLAVTGPTTLIGCANVPVASWLDDARRVGLADGVLVLVDGQGTETARLTRAG